MNMYTTCLHSNICMIACTLWAVLSSSSFLEKGTTYLMRLRQGMQIKSAIGQDTHMHSLTLTNTHTHSLDKYKAKHNYYNQFLHSHCLSHTPVSASLPRVKSGL